MKTKLFTLLFVLMASVGTMFAENGTCGENLTWDLTNGILTISGSGEMPAFTVANPAPWYKYEAFIQSVVISNGVTNVGQQAFYNCTALTSVSMANSVNSIGYAAFYVCSNLTSIEIPNGVTNIGQYAFGSCKKLTNIVLPNTITKIDTATFSECSSLTSIEIPNSVKSIEYCAFYDCTSLRSVVIPEGVTTIGEGVFCSSGSTIHMESLTLPSTIISIGDYLFCEDDDNWPDIYVPCGEIERFQQMLNINDKVQYAPLSIYRITTKESERGNIFVSNYRNYTVCDDIDVQINATPSRGYKFVSWTDGNTDNPRYIKLTQDTTMEAVYDYQLTGKCGKDNALTWTFDPETKTLAITGKGELSDDNYPYGRFMDSLAIGEGITRIGGGDSFAFGYCTNLKSVTIPSSLISIDGEEFSGPNLSSVYISDLAAWCKIRFAAPPANPLMAKAMRYSEEDEMSIGADLYLNGKLVTDLVIPESITTIGNCLFTYCNSLTSVEIPNSVTQIGMWAFLGCKNMKSAIISKNVTDINNLAFVYCSGLKSITCKAPTPPVFTIVESMYSENLHPFEGVDTINCTLYVPAESIDIYRKADGWKGFGTIKAIGEEKDYITVAEALAIGQKLAYGEESTESYTVEGYVAKLYNTYNAEMKRQSFYMCDTKEEVHPEGTGFKFEAFKAKLDKAVNPGAKVTVTGKITNYISSKGVQTIMIKDGTCKILEEAPECLVVKGACGDNLTWELDYCNGHLVISGTGAMYDYEKGAAPWCGGDAVSIATIENGVTSLGRYAFYGCSMDSIFIATSVSHIGFNTFNNCYNLQNFEVAQDNPVFCSVEGVLFNKNRTKIVRFPRGRSGEYVIPDGVEIVGAGAFNGCTEVTSVIIPNSVVTIDYAAFYNCQMQSVTIPAKVDSIGIMTFGYCPLTSVINYAEKPQKLHSDSIAFEGVDLSSCALYVPAESVKDYQTADIWKDFGTLIPMQAEEVTEPITDVETQPEDNSVVVTWPVVESADTYTLEIKKNSELICTLTFSADGRLMGIAFAPARNGSNHAPAAVKTANGGLRFTVTGLNSGTMYDLDVIAKDAMNQTITSYQKSFTTTGTATSLDQITNDQSPITNKVIIDGQILILRGDRTYTLTGQEVK